MALKRKRNSETLKEWMECGIITHNKNQVRKPLLPKFLIVAYDPESREDYPVYAEKETHIEEIKNELKQTGQKIVEVINL